MPPLNYNRHSHDAMFSRIESRLDEQDQILKKILTQTTLTNGRVTGLETATTFRAGWLVCAAAVGGIIATAIKLLLF